jgi:predicted ATPase/class 3 adenylate cyclase
VSVSPTVTTYLFTDIEGSTRLWEREPERMRKALARHDAIAREAVEDHRGVVIKMTGDGIHATFADPRDAVSAALHMQQALADLAATDGFQLPVRCGLHAGVDERRDSDFFGRAVNRAARIMSVAHGGQVLVSQAVAVLLRDRLPSDVTLRDLGSVRLRDLETPEQVYQLVHPGLRVDFPALRSLEATPNNLPLQLTSFVGREHEVAEITKVLGSTRLLTLLGVGGIGKTRLSLQVAADVMDDYPDGVWFVELAAVADAELVPQAVASVLGVKEAAGRPVIEALEKHVGNRQLLLVLDNCEHLVRACAELAKQLLQAGPRLKILASSREHLHVAGETTYSVPGLAVPEPSQIITPAALPQYESARLFIDRAKAAQPGLQVTEQIAAAIGEICRRLDGIPLAIELAAARVRALSVTEIAARLGDRFRLLTSGDRTALPRQQTLRALIDWSHDLLTETERILFRRLAVFAGGWTLEAAEAVASGDEVDEALVLDLLVDLVDKSLVVVEAERARYALLETVRQYAEERLTGAGEEEEVRKRHLDFYLAFVERAGAGLLGSEQPSWLKQLDLDRENLLAAHAWCSRGSHAAEIGYRLVHAIKLYWFMRGLLNLGYHVTVEAISVPTPQPHSLARCKALWVAGQIGSYTGRYEEAQRYLYESLEIARYHNDRRMIATVQTYLALAALGQGDRAAAQVHCEEALDLARELGNKREITVALNALAQLNRLDGKLDDAESLYEQAVTLARELRDREFEAIGILGLAMVAIGRGFAGAARELLREVLTIADETGSKTAGQSALEVSAGLAALQREWERSGRLFGAAEAQTLRTGIRRDPADEAFLQPLLASTREAFGEAPFKLAEASGRALPFDQALAEVRAWLSSRND